MARKAKYLINLLSNHVIGVNAAFHRDNAVSLVVGNSHCKRRSSVHNSMTAIAWLTGHIEGSTDYLLPTKNCPSVATVLWRLLNLHSNTPWLLRMLTNDARVQTTNMGTLP